jgi:hypothetical protein
MHAAHLVHARARAQHSCLGSAMESVTMHLLLLLSCVPDDVRSSLSSQSPRTQMAVRRL